MDYLEKKTVAPDVDLQSEVELCAICLVAPKAVRLKPCGHDQFCSYCVVHLFTCPLCRAPILREDGAPLVDGLGDALPTHAERLAEEERVVESRTVISEREANLARGVCFSVWLFIFIFGMGEYLHDIKVSCAPGDPRPGTPGVPEWLTSDNATCAVCKAENDTRVPFCQHCNEGMYNLGTQCFKYLENFPPMKTGAALGGTFYFMLIIFTQCSGIFTEVVLIRRLVLRRLLPRKEFYILAVALFIEISRMVLVDFFVMQEYFGGREYRIYRQPIACDESGITPPGERWQAEDGEWYCDDLSTYEHGVTEYYLASRRDAYSAERDTCSTFTTNSALLAFDEEGFQRLHGHTRFKTLGWAIGGEFAQYYFFATFINELADNMFVVPTTTSNGWLCKIFSIALEVFQLGALCPAAVFTHQDCLFFTNPLGVSMSVMSLVVITFGYLIWGFIFVTLPLGAAGFVILMLVAAVCWVQLQLLCPLLRYIAASYARRNRPLSTTAFSEMASRLERGSTYMLQVAASVHKQMQSGRREFLKATMVLAFVPMLLAGMFLGTLVVAGQASKQGPMKVLTAVVLLFDVLFKVVATLVTEIGEYLLHIRVRHVVESGANVAATSTEELEVEVFVPGSSSPALETTGTVIGAASSSSDGRAHSPGGRERERAFHRGEVRDVPQAWQGSNKETE
eukprot:TRINITY_DN30585_c0_g1_i1.p1 TRINITY_DN30585_c0_g1~~TRINITY_DN30585_c0_g1_i1.p1  ORF type:complete len:681 (-),score=96.47 TRINITY_DN30585_c0_g1_i1:99-2141(-)